MITSIDSDEDPLWYSPSATERTARRPRMSQHFPLGLELELGLGHGGCCCVITGGLVDFATPGQSRCGWGMELHR